MKTIIRFGVFLFFLSLGIYIGQVNSQQIIFEIFGWNFKLGIGVLVIISFGCGIFVATIINFFNNFFRKLFTK